MRSTSGQLPRTCVNGNVGFPKRAEALVEPLIQLQAVVVCCSGDAEHHDTKANGALVVVLELCVAAPQQHPRVRPQPLEVGCVSRVPAAAASTSTSHPTHPAAVGGAAAIAQLKGYTCQKVAV